MNLAWCRAGTGLLKNSDSIVKPQQLSSISYFDSPWNLKGRDRMGIHD